MRSNVFYTDAGIHHGFAVGAGTALVGAIIVLAIPRTTDLAEQFQHARQNLGLTHSITRTPTAGQPRRRVPAHRDFDCPGTALIV
ncbi:hypothetical protein K7711_12405 [Nocardia sp. CA2R105]|uniref:hypothetical protein n=1 Tax=Nocardia coffeae TaxID=2873381 RepID=UPI001CA688BC|nr:hypothetical protein [Nocardia coffeae]MBY8857283.1 hypothetical protein [Nocardia coffeae]